MSFKPTQCTNKDCQFSKESGGHFVKRGFYLIKRVNQKVCRYQCKSCGTTFSSRSFQPDFRHKKMDLNEKLRKLLVEGNSIRGCSRILQMTYKNTYRKFLWLTQYMKILKEQIPFKANDLYLDEMETIHHTKCKPLSIALFVSENYKILDMGVAQMPAKGRLAHFSREKYGIRPDERATVRRILAKKVQKNLINSPQVIRTDANPNYPPLIQEFFPTLKHEVFNRVQKVRHQEKLHEKLHKTVYDPLFPLNQRCAKLRSDIRRLTRRSWCTTKKIENLQGHLDLYIVSQYLF